VKAATGLSVTVPSVATDQVPARSVTSFAQVPVAVRRQTELG